MRYRVHDGGRTGHLTEPDEGPYLREVEADRVILAAGTFGTQLLLRRNANRLPRLSPRLGEGISANGDLLTFAARCDADRPLHPHDGPVITTAIEKIEGPGGFYLQDAGFPAIGEWLFHALGLAEDIWEERRELFRLLMRALQKKREANISGELASLGGRGATSACLLPLLGMGRDVPDGRMGIDEQQRLDLRLGDRQVAPVLRGGHERRRDHHPRARRRAVGHGDRRARADRDGASARRLPDGRGRVARGGRHVGRRPRLRGPLRLRRLGDAGRVGANPSLTIAAFAERVAAGIVDAG